MKIIDMHCDTISELADRGGELWKNSGHLDLKRMQESGYLLQNFALFVDIGKCTPTPWERVCALYEVYRTELEKNKNRIVPVLCYEDILKNEACGNHRHKWQQHNKPLHVSKSRGHRINTCHFIHLE